MVEKKPKKALSDLGKTGGLLKGSVLAGTCRKVKVNRRALLFTMLFDLLFLLALAGLNLVLNILVPPSVYASPLGNPLLIILRTLGIFAFAAVLSILLYSFFKFVVIWKVKSIFEKAVVEWPVFWRFFFLNIIILGIYFVVFIFFSLLFITTVRIEALIAVRTFVIVLVGLFAYLTINTSHSLFARLDGSTGQVVKQSLDLVFSRFRMYAGLIGFTLLASAVLTGVYYAFDWILLTILGDAIAVPSVFLGYAVVNTLVVFILAFGLLAFNRVYFYGLVMESKRFITKRD